MPSFQDGNSDWGNRLQARVAEARASGIDGERGRAVDARRSRLSGPCPRTEARARSPRCSVLRCSVLGPCLRTEHAPRSSAVLAYLPPSRIAILYWR